MNKLIEYAQRRLDEAYKNNEDALTIRYWVGYLDALRAVERIGEEKWKMINN